MPPSTPPSGAWLGLAESIRRILVRRALAGEAPTSPDDLIDWLEATARGRNADPTPCAWAARRRLLHPSSGPPAADRPRSMAPFVPRDPLGEDGRYRLGPVGADGIFTSPVVTGFRLRVAWLWQRPLPTLAAALADLPG